MVSMVVRPSDGGKPRCVTRDGSEWAVDETCGQNEYKLSSDQMGFLLGLCSDRQQVQYVYVCLTFKCSFLQ